MTTSTPTRKQERERARAERERREQEEALKAQRKRRLMYLGGGLLVLIAIVAVVIAVASGGGSSSSSSTKSANVSGASEVANQYAGIPQKGNVLGSPSAPATMMVFADVQCPYCAQFETKAFPSIVQRYVKTGKLKVIFQPISIIGNDSVTGARAVGAAAQQNKMFNYTSLWYNNQGEENTGYVTQDFMTKLANATPGLDTAKWKSDLNSQPVGNLLSRAQSAAQTAGVSSTPTFLVAKKGQTLQQFQPSALAASAFYGKLDALTK